MSEEKDKHAKLLGEKKQNSPPLSSPSFSTKSNARDKKISSSPAAWLIPKSPMDDVFRARLGGLDREPASRVLATGMNDDEEEEVSESESESESKNGDSDENAPWNIPTSPYDAVFRKRAGGLGGTPIKIREEVERESGGGVIDEEEGEEEEDEVNYL